MPAGRDDWTQHLWVVETDHSRALSLSGRITHGDFRRGTQKNVQTSVLYRPNHRLFVDVGLQVTDISLDHHPLSDFFIVYNEQQYTDGHAAAGRGPVMKYTHLFSF